MYSIGQIDKNGFISINSASTSINFGSSGERTVSEVKIVENICRAAKKYIENSPIIKDVRQYGRSFEVYLKQPVEPTNLQYADDSKKYLKMNLATKGIEWDWLSPPEIGLFRFEVYSNNNSDGTIPVGCYAFAGKTGNEYINCRHPNVSDNGSICMGGFSGHETMGELSIGSLSAMLRNFALYSSFFKPVLVDKASKCNITVNCPTIKSVISSDLDSSESRILAKHTTIEEWL